VREFEITMLDWGCLLDAMTKSAVLRLSTSLLLNQGQYPGRHPGCHHKVRQLPVALMPAGALSVTLVSISGKVTLASIGSNLIILPLPIDTM
jgi:hypothetical protein